MILLMDSMECGTPPVVGDVSTEVYRTLAED